MSTTLSLTEAAVFGTLGAALTGFGLISSTSSPVSVVRGQTNRVPMPRVPDFVVMWPIRRPRLSTNVTTYTDNYITGSITSNVLTVASVISGSVQLGAPIIGLGVTPGCYVISQLSGVTGGVGTYSTSPTANANRIPLIGGDGNPVVGGDGNPVYVYGTPYLSLGTAGILQPVEVVIQCDVHGPASGDNAQIISTYLRDDAGVQAFRALVSGIEPLYADDPRQIPFINGEAQFEERWCIDVHLQANPVITTSAQFATALSLSLYPVENYP